MGVFKIQFKTLALLTGFAIGAGNAAFAAAPLECLDSNGIPVRQYVDAFDGKTYPCDTFENVIFSGAKTKNFPKESFKGATISWGTFRISQLQKFDFSNVTIKNSIFYGANFTGATISGTVTDSVFGSACLCGTDLTKAKFKDTKFYSAKYDEDTKFPPEIDDSFKKQWRMELRVDCEQSCFTPEKKRRPEEIEPEALPPADIEEVLRRKVPKQRRRDLRKAKPLQDRLEICLTLDRSGSMDGHYKNLLSKFQSLEAIWAQGFPQGVIVHLVEVANNDAAPNFVLRGKGLSDFKNYLSNLQPTGGGTEPMIDGAMLCASAISSHLNAILKVKTKRALFVATDDDGEQNTNQFTRAELEKKARDIDSDLDWINMDRINAPVPPKCPRLLELGLDPLDAVQQVEQLVANGKCQDSVTEYLAAKLPGTLPPIDPQNPALKKLFHLSLLKQSGLEEEYQEALVELLLDPVLRSIALYQLLGRDFVPGQPVVLTDDESRKLLIEMLVYLEAEDAFKLIQEFNLIRGKKQLYDWLEDDSIEPNVKEGILRLLTEMDGQINDKTKADPKSQSKKGPKTSQVDQKFRQKQIELLDSDDVKTRENALQSFIQTYRKDSTASKLFLEKAVTMKDQAFVARVIGAAGISEAGYLLYTLLKNPDTAVQKAAIEAMGELDSIVENSSKEALDALLPKLSDLKFKTLVIPVVRKIYQAGKLASAGQLILSELESWMNRLQAIQIISTLKLKEGVPYLWQALGTASSSLGQSQSVSDAALTSLADFEVPELKERMFDLIRDAHRGALARGYLAKTLNLQNQENQTDLNRLIHLYIELKKSIKGQTTLAACDQDALNWLTVKLKTVRTKGALEFWKDYAKSLNVFDRLEALRVFDELGEIEPIKAMLNDADRNVRVHALSVLKSKKIEVPAPPSAQGTSVKSNANGSSSEVGEVEDSTFNSLVLSSKVPVLVKFTATWCGPCRMLKPTIEKLAAEYKGRLKIVELDVDQNPSNANKYQASKLPTLILFQEGVEKGRWGPNDIDFYRWQIDQILGAK